MKKKQILQFICFATHWIHVSNSLAMYADLLHFFFCYKQFSEQKTFILNLLYKQVFAGEAEEIMHEQKTESKLWLRKNICICLYEDRNSRARYYSVLEK